MNQTAVDYCRQVKDAGVSLPSAVFMSSLKGSVAEMTRLNLTYSETEQKGKNSRKLGCFVINVLAGYNSRPQTSNLHFSS